MIATKEKKVVRCAIYTRKSNEDGLEQAYNSLHAQRAMCESYIASFASEGWTALATDYSDGGISGGTMERPGLQRLLADIEVGLVDVVVIYRLDRLSRSLRDFLNMIESFEGRGVSFASVTERIDTTSSAGRLFLNMILSFAQFEREVAAERIRDKIASAKRKGKYVGGRPLLGYDVDREKMRLVVNGEEAKLVRHIFQRFCQLGSCMKVAHELNAKGHRMKAWTSKKGTRKTTTAILKGILRCGCCDAAMVPSYTTRRGKRYHYYLCHAAGKKGHDSCEVKSVAAGQIEGAVFTYLKDIFADPEMIARTFRGMRDRSAEDRQREAAAESGGQDDMPSEQDVAAALRTIEPLWEELFPAEKERIVRLLVETVTVRPDGLSIRLRPTGLITLAAEIGVEELEPEEATV
jgi:DNA invertase Pin-like site-specific DNA recombinase